MGKQRREAPRVTAQHRRRQERLRALVSREKTQTAFAAKYGLNHKHVSQMLSTPGTKGWRGVGDDTVEKLELQSKKLGIEPGYFDAETPSAAVSEQLPAGLVASRSKNDVRALRMAFESLATVLHRQQSGLAEAVAQDVVATAGTKFVAQGWLGILVAQLLGVPEMSEEELHELQQAPTSKASKRAV